MIEIVTFTGIDEKTDIGRATAIGTEHRFAELAVLAGSSTGHHRRFPRLETIDWFRNAAVKAGVRRAIHLCGRVARGVRDGQLETAAKLAEGFERVQVNLPTEGRAAAASHAGRLAAKSGCTVVIQHEGKWDTVPAAAGERLEYLFDPSGGRGKEAFSRWPDPPEGRTQRWGYAGGIGPSTLDAALAFAGAHAEARLWLDMESGVRDESDALDLGKVEEICNRVEEWNRRQDAAGPARRTP